MKIKDLELLETLTKMKQSTKDIEGSAWAIDGLYSVIKQNEELVGKTPEELREMSRVMAETLTAQQADTITGYIQLAQLVIVLLNGVDALTHVMLKQNKNNELGLQFTSLSDAIYQNIVGSGLLTVDEVVKLRQESVGDINGG